VSATGRIDIVVIREDTVYVFEFKLSSGETAEDALRADRCKEVSADLQRTEGKTLVKVGVEFDQEKHIIGKWISA
jgi:hypothetical protein